MTTIIISKDVGDVKDKIINSNIKKDLEDCNEDYIKLNMDVLE